MLEVQAQGDRATWAHVHVQMEASEWSGALEAAQDETVDLGVSLIDGATHGESATLEQGDLGRW